MSSFGITRLETQKDEGLLSKESCRKRTLKEIEINIQNFKNDGWSEENQMHTLLAFPIHQNLTHFPSYGIMKLWRVMKNGK